MNLDEYKEIGKQKRLSNLFCPISHLCERNKISLSYLYVDMEINKEDLIKIEGKEVIFHTNKQKQGFENFCPEISLRQEYDEGAFFPIGGFAFSSYIIDFEQPSFDETITYKHYSSCLEYLAYEFNNKAEKQHVNIEQERSFREKVSDSFGFKLSILGFSFDVKKFFKK